MKDDARLVMKDEIRQMNTRGIIVLCLAVGGFILGLIAKAL